ncbi:MAG: exodeoxyribonuclease III [candidate division WOR-3 bacterium]|nr:exodeoxyribonuclease III [candidate division WOR-3 bacterium]
MEIVTFNVNGLRAILKKGFMGWFREQNPDILCLQETKVNREQLEGEILNPEGYYTYWNSGERKGYSGVITFSKEKPLETQFGMGIERFDKEGRLIRTKYKDFTLFNVYFPNGKSSDERLKFKLDYYDAFLEHCESLHEKGEEIIITGDLNTAHKEIDLANPEANEKFSGFLPIEREWVSKFISRGYIDTFRHFHPEPEEYTWWTYRFNARKRNIGWRLDYFFVTEGLMQRVKDSIILKEVYGSDHAPILLEIE